MMAAVSLANAQLQKNQTLYKDEGKSSIEYIKDKESGMLGVKIEESTYKTFYADILNNDNNNYVAKLKTNTLKYFATEGQQSTISGEIYSLDNPKKIISRFSHTADEIYFETDHYLTIKYGCCASPNIPSLYDYKHRLIIDGENNISKADFYSKGKVINMYTSIKSVYESKDTIGLFTYAYSAEDKYQIYFLSQKKSSFCNDYSLLYKASLKNNAEVNMFSELNGMLSIYEFENLKDVHKITDINDIVFNIQYQCFSYSKEPVDASLADKTYTTSIPIINGKPFGKSDRIQIVKVNVD